MCKPRAPGSGPEPEAWYSGCNSSWVMRTSTFLGAALIVAIPWLGCANEPSRAPVEPRAAHATRPERMGQTELQAAEEPSVPDSTSSLSPMPPPAAEALVAVRPDGTPVSAREIQMVTVSAPSARSTMQTPGPATP
jgi:hypothetical protein